MLYSVMAHQFSRDQMYHLHVLSRRDAFDDKSVSMYAATVALDHLPTPFLVATPVSVMGACNEISPPTLGYRALVLDYSRQ
jgi:hypothetical protein